MDGSAKSYTRGQFPGLGAISVTDQTIRVCFVVNSVHGTSVPADIATALAKYTNVEVDILAWFSAEPFEADDLVDVHCLNAPRPTLGITPKTVQVSYRMFCDYDVIQVHQNHSGSIAKLLARVAGVPTVSREGNTRDGFTFAGRLANGITNALAHRVVPNAEAVFDSFSQWERLLLSEHMVEIINNGVDFERINRGISIDWSVREECDIDDEAHLVGNCAMLTEQKAHDVLVRAIANAQSRLDKPLEVVIAGDGPKRYQIGELAKELGLRDQLHLLGTIDRQYVYKLLDEIDVYAMPSRWEGQSLAAIEALAVGNACVFSDIPPFRIPFDDVSAFHPIDDPKALADVIVELTDPDRRQVLRARGKELAETEYSIEQVVQQYADLYRRLLDE